MTLTPAYGRDYKNKKAIEASLAAGEDFVMNDYGHPYDGRYVNIEGLRHEGCVTVNVRYGNLRKVCVIKVPYPKKGETKPSEPTYFEGVAATMRAIGGDR